MLKSRSLILLLFLITPILITGCAPYKCVYFDPDHSECSALNSCAPLYRMIPRHRCQLHWYDAGHWLSWCLAGNDDHGIFGEAHDPPFCEGEPNNFGKFLKWQVRNPLHNLTFYVVGSAYRCNSRLTLLSLAPEHSEVLCYHPCACYEDAFPSPNSCFFLGLHGGKPFVALRLRYSACKKSDFYLGWRSRGTLGVKLKFLGS